VATGYRSEERYRCRWRLDNRFESCHEYQFQKEIKVHINWVSGGVEKLGGTCVAIEVTDGSATYVAALPSDVKAVDVTQEEAKELTELLVLLLPEGTEGKKYTFTMYDGIDSAWRKVAQWDFIVKQ
jgi:hypothetical protein